MSNKLRILLIAVITIAGVLLLGYPAVSTYLAERNGSKVVQEYDEGMAQIAQEKLTQELAQAQEYNRNLATNVVLNDPFSGQESVATEDYFEQLNLSAAMATVNIPKLSLQLPIYHGTSDLVLQQGIGHIVGTSLPIGGLGTHCVVAGHTGLSNAKMFTDLADMEKGDVFYIHVLGQTLQYEVDQILVVEPDDTRSLQIVPGEDHVTLLTCTPYGINTQRLLVRGTRVPFLPPEIVSVQAVSQTDWMLYQYAIVTSLLMLVLILLVLWVRHCRKRAREWADRHQH